MKPIDNDIEKAICWARLEAEHQSSWNGPNHPETREVRRIEVVLCRLAREAGYDLTKLEANHE